MDTQTLIAVKAPADSRSHLEVPNPAETGVRLLSSL
jgi:hypothetical protein